MEEVIKLKFTDVSEYRKEIGRHLVLRGLENFTKRPVNVLEIGPGSSLFLVEKLRSKHFESYFFIEPNEKFKENLLGLNYNLKFIGDKIEQVYLSELNYDFVYSNFAIHWSEKIEDTFVKIKKSLQIDGAFCFSVTDPSRSFWASVNQKFKKKFSGCDLFNRSPLKSFSKSDWKNVLKNSGFKKIDIINFEGQASVSFDGESALNEFKKACGDRYLLLENNVSSSEVEYWLVNYLNSLKNSEGVISIPASGLGFICVAAE